MNQKRVLRMARLDKIWHMPLHFCEGWKCSTKSLWTVLSSSRSQILSKWGAQMGVFRGWDHIWVLRVPLCYLLSSISLTGVSMRTERPLVCARTLLKVREVVKMNHTKMKDVNWDCPKGTLSPKPEGYLSRFGVVLCGFSFFPTWAVMSDLGWSKATEDIKTLVDSTIILDKFYPEFLPFPILTSFCKSFLAKECCEGFEMLLSTNSFVTPNTVRHQASALPWPW